MNIEHMNQDGPFDQSLRIVNELTQRMGGMPEALTRLPLGFFRELCAIDDIASSAAAIEVSIAGNVAFNGRVDYLLAVLRTCAYCAHATRMPDRQAWDAVLQAQRHAGVALATLVSSLEASERQSALSRSGKNAQIKINNAIRKHVLDAAAESSLTTVSGAAENIVNLLASEPGGLKGALVERGSSLSPEHEKLARVFAEYIKADMERLKVRTQREVVAQPENKARFARWKELYVCQANG